MSRPNSPSPAHEEKKSTEKDGKTPSRTTSEEEKIKEIYDLLPEGHVTKNDVIFYNKGIERISVIFFAEEKIGYYIAPSQVFKTDESLIPDDDSKPLTLKELTDLHKHIQTVLKPTLTEETQQTRIPISQIAQTREEELRGSSGLSEEQIAAIRAFEDGLFGRSEFQSGIGEAMFPPFGTLSQDMKTSEAVGFPSPTTSPRGASSVRNSQNTNDQGQS